MFSSADVYFRFSYKTWLKNTYEDIFKLQKFNMASTRKTKFDNDVDKSK